MLSISDVTKEYISKTTGMEFDKIEKTGFDELDGYIEARSRKRLEFDDMNKSRILSRGNPYIFLKRFLRIDKIMKQLERIH